MSQAPILSKEIGSHSTPLIFFLINPKNSAQISKMPGHKCAFSGLLLFTLPIQNILS